MEIKDGVIVSPFTYNKDLLPRGGFEVDYDGIQFINTSYITSVAKHFKKYGKYPFPPPVKKDDKDIYYKERFKQTAIYPDYKKFWDREENRRRNGIILDAATAGGKIMKVHITGEHYSYLNYSQIMHDDTTNYKGTEKIFKNNKAPVFAKVKGQTPQMSFPDFWDGDYQFFHCIDTADKYGLNVIVDKTRQVGYSHKNSSMARDDYDLYPNSTSVIGAFDSKYLDQGDSIFNMAKEKIFFINKYTDWDKTITIDNHNEIKCAYKYKGDKTLGGRESKLLAASFFNNTGALRGKKPTRRAYFDEAGKWPNLRDSYLASMKSLKEGDVVTAMFIVFGTGGGPLKDWYDFSNMYYNPLDYDFIPFKNIWDKNVGEATAGFFHPRYLNYKPYYDKDGNSDIKLARAKIEEKRKVWSESGDETLYRSNIAEEPMSPSESFLSGTTNIFSSASLDNHTNNVRYNADYKLGMHGIMVNLKGEVQFKSNSKVRAEYQHPPIESVVRKDKEDVTGCVTIYFQPTKVGGVIPPKLYYAIYDPFATDTAKDQITIKHSFGAMYIYEDVNNYNNTYGDRLVAKYVGRPPKVDMYNETAFMLLDYYGCTDKQLYFESNRGRDVLAYARRTKKTHYLCNEYVFDKAKADNHSKSINYGITMNAGRIDASISFLREWLYQPRSKDDGNGDELYNLHYIYDPLLLGQLGMYSKSGNFDSISAVQMLYFIVKEKEHSRSKDTRATIEDGIDNVFNINNIISQ